MFISEVTVAALSVTGAKQPLIWRLPPIRIIYFIIVSLAGKTTVLSREKKFKANVKEEECRISVYFSEVFQSMLGAGLASCACAFVLVPEGSWLIVLWHSLKRWDSKSFLLGGRKQVRAHVCVCVCVPAYSKRPWNWHKCYVNEFVSHLSTPQEC